MLSDTTSIHFLRVDFLPRLTGTKPPAPDMAMEMQSCKWKMKHL